MLKKKSLSNEEFLRRVRDYLPMDAAIWRTDERGAATSCALSCGLKEDHFYLFDAESVLATSHAIEELALDKAAGTLLATMQDFRYFDPHRERYWQLAATLDRVRVVARGRKRPPHDHLKFIASNHPAIRPFWTVLYECSHFRVMFICRQTNGTDVFEEKRFTGFYSFSADVTGRIRDEIEGVLAGRGTAIAEFDRLRAIDRVGKQVQASFGREQQALESALRKLRTDGVRYPSRRFTADLDRSVSRLKQLTVRVPALIGDGGDPIAA